MGIDRSMEAAQKAKVILMMTEPGVPYPDIPVRENQTLIRIENKTEAFQAKYGIGLDTLRQQLLDAVPQTADSEVIISNARHYQALIKANESLSRVINGLHQQLSGDLISEDLRQVLSELAEITGEGQITPNEVLNNIFQHFCVGK
jgi:tRNA modification GTPase